MGMILAIFQLEGEIFEEIDVLKIQQKRFSNKWSSKVYKATKDFIKPSRLVDGEIF